MISSSLVSMLQFFITVLPGKDVRSSLMSAELTVGASGMQSQSLKAEALLDTIFANLWMSLMM